ncbi:MAG: FprA family A-type flavoprotein [Syntrophobacterales bacterium]|nr:FprA family A-type flavoprotein [Syntrophobacterales bacterium]
MPVTIAPQVYWVGAIDWTMRDFHGYLTEAGSTYNAFLIVDEKVTLIDTVKKGFLPEMLARIREILPLERIDYIVCNHVEMDHSGSLAELARIARPEKIFCSSLGKVGLTRHYKEDLPLVEVKTGTEVSLGRHHLMFLETPMLHWPDSMMTFLKEEQILFSSDGFGAHYASSQRLIRNRHDCPPKYFYELKKYYANILMPMGTLVTQLLDKVAKLGLEFRMIAPDHGCVYENPDWVLEAYRTWAAGVTQPKGLVIYDTMWHSTEMLAHAFMEGLMDAGVEAQLHHLRATHYSDTVTELLDAGLMFLGSPTINNNMFPSMGQFLTYLKGLKPKKKAAMAFGSYGWSGQAVGLINQELEAMQLKPVHEGLQVRYIPDPDELAQARELGARLAREHLLKSA